MKHPVGAIFSRDRAYRYRLWRHWDAGKRPLLMVMLNPSTADETKNDPTVERCERRARALGYGGLLVGNIFALRSTDPRMLYSHAAPVGRANNAAIIAMAREAEHVVCAWGVHGALAGRGRAVTALLERQSIGLHALGVTRDGHPRHPLYLANAAPLCAWAGYADK